MGFVKENRWFLPALASTQGEFELSTFGAIRRIHGWVLGAIGVAPSAALAVDNPLGLSPAVVSGTLPNARLGRWL
jgi:hypothetical protein